MSNAYPYAKHLAERLGTVLTEEKAKEHGDPLIFGNVFASMLSIFVQAKINTGRPVQVTDAFTVLDMMKQARSLAGMPSSETYMDAAGYNVLAAAVLMPIELENERQAAEKQRHGDEAKARRGRYGLDPETINPAPSPAEVLGAMLTEPGPGELDLRKSPEAAEDAQAAKRRASELDTLQAMRREIEATIAKRSALPG